MKRISKGEWGGWPWARPLLAALTLASLWGRPATARADAFAISLKNEVPAGQKPSLTIVVNEPLSDLKLDLVRDDGKVFSHSAASARRGQRIVVPFSDGTGGRFHWKGTLAVTLANKQQLSQELTFDTVTTGTLKLSYRRDKLDLDGHALEFQQSRPAGSAELKVFAEDGTLVGSGRADYKREAPGTWLRVTWTPTSTADVFRLELRAVDADGVATQLRLMPWSIYVAHEEVLFETGKWEVRKSEEQKLDQSYGKLVEAVARARKADPNLPVRVFIAGHTDTVGSADDNRRLSLERARAIASWFRDRGLPLPLAYAGFGEDVPKIKTGDNVAEERNRRVDYILGVEEPQLRGGRNEWHKL